MPARHDGFLLIFEPRNNASHSLQYSVTIPFEYLFFSSLSFFVLPCLYLIFIIF
ncbi:MULTISPECIES: hypothetical protein [unclassified Rickettsia]|uniref:hypothetical protein n=1 Tax=unclassified Rickettsia TaxID=114295 RepID=UPI003132D32F